MALVRWAMRSDNDAMGRAVTVDGSVTRPLMGEPQFLKHCISNLIDNATTYGRQADIRVEEDSGHLTIRVRDHGPWIPEDNTDGGLEAIVSFPWRRTTDE
jgi:signal transduction histidine kinase